MAQPIAYEGHQPVKASSVLAFGTVGNVVVAVWRGDPDLKHCETLLDELERQSSLNPGKTALLIVVEPSSGNPDKETRDYNQRRLQEIGDRVAGIATVFEGNGVRAVAVRLIMTTMTAFDERHQFFKNMEGARGWIQTKVPEISPVLLNRVEMIRSRIK